MWGQKVSYLAPAGLSVMTAASPSLPVTAETEAAKKADAIRSLNCILIGFKFEVKVFIQELKLERGKFV